MTDTNDISYTTIWIGVPLIKTGNKYEVRQVEKEQGFFQYIEPSKAKPFTNKQGALKTHSFKTTGGTTKRNNKWKKWIAKTMKKYYIDKKKI